MGIQDRSYNILTLEYKSLQRKSDHDAKVNWTDIVPNEEEITLIKVLLDFPYTIEKSRC